MSPAEETLAGKVSERLRPGGRAVPAGAAGALPARPAAAAAGPGELWPHRADAKWCWEELSFVHAQILYFLGEK